MGDPSSSGALRRLTPHVHAWTHPTGTWGWSNAGLVADRQDAVLVDTQFTVGMTRRLRDAVVSAVPGVRVSTVVNTHANGDHCWGNGLFPGAAVVASAGTADEVAGEITPEVLRQVVAAAPPGGPLAAYLDRYFAPFDFADITVVPPTATFRGDTSVYAGGVEVRLLELGPAHTHGDTVAWVPEDGVLFAGDLLFVGDHPIAWSGPLDNWVRACDAMLATGADTIVPGHGPVTTPAAVRTLRHHLEYVAEQARQRCAAGMDWRCAAADIPVPGYAAGWGNPERIVFLVAAEYRSAGAPAPGDQASLLAAAADLAAHRR
ncbi:MAG TPA: MBL fold metallo-hydrolase [Actinocatenispora sp.]